MRGSISDQLVRRTRIVLPAAVLWSLLLLVLCGVDVCLYVQRGVLPWLGPFFGVGWWLNAKAICVIAAVVAHPIRPHWLTALISIAGVSIWYWEGLVDLAVRGV